ncbi:MAG: hypothetical protein QOK05_1578 [Chloroflexota bacterium]|nr:hypothetical protein [Chloroflexota bacterium]
MLSLREVQVPGAPTNLVFTPHVIDGTGPAADIDSLMLVMEAFAGYDSCVLTIEDPQSESLWDDALDVRVACL